jgi:hypothetical protein
MGSNRSRFIHIGRRLGRKLGLGRLRKSPVLSHYHELNLPLDIVDSIIREAHAQEWFVWSIHNRGGRGEAVAAMDWIAANVERRIPILEVGCGCAANLIWLGQHGFVCLAGRDASTEAIVAARGLADLARLPMELAVDDFLTSELPIPNIGLLLALNCLYYSPQFHLGRFLMCYHPALEDGGFVVFDMVDAMFNRVPNNQYLTNDWHLRASRRRPTQYAIRMTQNEVRDMADTAGYDVICMLPGTELPPRFVAVLKRRQ